MVTRASTVSNLAQLSFARNSPRRNIERVGGEAVRRRPYCLCQRCVESRSGPSVDQADRKIYWIVPERSAQAVGVWSTYGVDVHSILSCSEVIHVVLLDGETMITAEMRVRWATKSQQARTPNIAPTRSWKQHRQHRQSSRRSDVVLDDEGEAAKRTAYCRLPNGRGRQWGKPSSQLEGTRSARGPALCSTARTNAKW